MPKVRAIKRVLRSAQTTGKRNQKLREQLQVAREVARAESHRSQELRIECMDKVRSISRVWAQSD